MKIDASKNGDGQDGEGEDQNPSPCKQKKGNQEEVKYKVDPERALRTF